jgi:hypothetical protein
VAAAAKVPRMFNALLNGNENWSESSKKVTQFDKSTEQKSVTLTDFVSCYSQFCSRNRKTETPETLETHGALNTVKH